MNDKDGDDDMALPISNHYRVEGVRPKLATTTRVVLEPCDEWS